MATQYLCSEEVVERMKPVVVSKPFQDPLEFEKYYIAELNYEEASRIYDEITDQLETEFHEFWFWECAPGLMDTSTITKEMIRDMGLIGAIEFKLNLTKEKNIAMCIYNIANDYGLTPIELVNETLP